MSQRAGRALLYCAGGGIGDSLVASVTGRALLQRFERVDALTLPGHRGALERIPEYGDVLIDNGDPAAVAAQVQERAYDACVVTWATAHTATVARRSGIPIRVGQARRLYSTSFTHRVVVRSETGDITSHWSDILLDYARALGCDTDDRRPHFEPNAADIAQAQALRERLQLDGPFAIVHPTCAASVKRGFWPVQGWIVLVKALRERYGVRVLISGAPDDVPLVEPVCDATGADLLAGQTTIGGFAALARDAFAFAVMHSGPMHVAAAVGAPTAGIFPLQVDFPDRWRPIGPRVSVVRASYPCRAGERIETCPDYACVAALDVPRVIAAIDTLVSKA